MARTIKQLIAAKNRPDTPEDIQDRIIRRTAGEHAKADRANTFPVLDADNAAAALDYQEARTEYWLRLLRKERSVR